MCFRKQQEITWQLSALQQIEIKVATATMPTGSPGDLLGGICQQPAPLWTSTSPPADAASRDPLHSWFAPSPPVSSPLGGTGQPPVSAHESAWGSSLPPEPCSCQLFVYPLHREKQMQFVLISPGAGCRISTSHTRNIRIQWIHKDPVVMVPISHKVQKTENQTLLTSLFSRNFFALSME